MSQIQIDPALLQDGITEAVTQAATYSDAGDATTLTSANSHSDTGDTNTLNSANEYADNKFNNVESGKMLALTTTDPADYPLINFFVIKSGVTGAGTYTKFLSAPATPIVFNATSDSLASKSWQMVRAPGQIYWAKDEIVNAVDLSGYYTRTEADSQSLPAQKLIVLSNGQSANLVSGTTTGYYIKRTDGILSATPGWISTDFIPVDATATIIRVGHAFNNNSPTSPATPLAFYDSNHAFLGCIEGAVLPTQSFAISSYFSSTAFIKLGSSTAVGIQAFVQYTVNIASIKNVSSNYDFAQKLVPGVLNNANQYLDLATWVRTNAIPVKAGDVLTYTGVTTSGTGRMIGLDSNGGFVAVLLAGSATLATATATVTSGITYVIANFTATSGTKSVIKSVYVWEPIQQNLNANYFLPPVIYGKVGEELRINPNGIIAKSPLDRKTDIVWVNQTGNERFLSFTPTADNQTINLKIRGITTMDSLGSIAVKATTTPVSPVAAKNVVYIADSTGAGLAYDGSIVIDGAIINEVSRRLTGVGTSATPATAPTPLALSNIYFRGTLGTNPVKHEGRGGWSIRTYLTAQNQSGNTNAFWNPSTLQFDLTYYLTQNNFLSTQTTGGVDDVGSNLVIYFQCIWNSVYAQNLDIFKADLTTILNKISTAYPQAQVKIVGIWPGNADNYRAFTDNRNVSAESIMRDAVIPYSNAIVSVIGGNTKYEYLPIAPCFEPEDSFPIIAKPLHKRTTTTRNYYLDHVHPNANGYGQIADIIFYNFLYNYCR